MRRASPAFERALVLSTAHVPEPGRELDDFLDFDSTMPRVTDHEHGWIVFLTADDDRPVPEWFAPIRDLAVREDVSFVVFDAAGQTLDSLPTYDW